MLDYLAHLVPAGPGSSNVVEDALAAPRRLEVSQKRVLWKPMQRTSPTRGLDVEQASRLASRHLRTSSIASPALLLAPRSGSSVPGPNLGSGSPRTGSCVWRGAGADRTFSGDLLLPRLGRVALGAPRWCPYSLAVRGRPSGQALRDIGTSDRREG